jgi:hypothetical protein
VQLNDDETRSATAGARVVLVKYEQGLRVFGSGNNF